MKTHRLKCRSEPFEAILQGVKTHETRKNDRNFQVGDILVLREWDPEQPWLGPDEDGGYGFEDEEGNQDSYYSGREFKVLVTYLSKGPDWNLPEGIVVMSITEWGSERG